jgi:thymidine kinase
MVERYAIAKKRCIIIKYHADNRYNYLSKAGGIVSHRGDEYANVPNTVCRKLGEVDVADCDVIGIDEGQFFPDITEMSSLWANSGKIVICAYLDGRADMKPFGDVGQMIIQSEHILKLSAICFNCQRDASFNHRLVNTADSLSEDIGGADKYVALCRDCKNTYCKLN